MLTRIEQVDQSGFQLLTPRQGDAEAQIHLLVQGVIAFGHIPMVVGAADGSGLRRSSLPGKHCRLAREAPGYTRKRKWADW